MGKSNGDIRKCIQSALAQRCASIEVEVFVIMNGPVLIEDHTNIYELFPSESFIRLAECTNGNTARNYGVRMAAGAFVAFLDSDDWWEPTHLKKSVDTIRLENTGMSYGSIVVHDRTGKESTLRAVAISEYQSAENYLLAYMPAQTSSYVVATNIAKSLTWDESLHRHQDYDWFSKFHKHHSSSVVSDALVHIDWPGIRRTKHHRDYVRVALPWKNLVERRYYIRHLRNLLLSAIRSRDAYALNIFLILIVEIFSRHKINS